MFICVICQQAFNVDITINDIVGSRLWTINFYREQLKYFAKVGLGNRTQHNVVVTKELIAVTEKRLSQLTTIYDKSLTPDGLRHRKYKAKGRLNGQNHTNGNGATASSGMQDNGDTRHARDKT